ncbi:MAG: ROK family protein [Thermoguttaceae bacterium]
MATADKGKKTRLYLGIDVGGTKIQASLVEESGGLLACQRAATPRDGGPEQVLVTIERLVEAVLQAGQIQPADLTAVGIAVPGVVDPASGRVIFTPNMNLTGVAIGPHVEGRFQVPVALGNDCNLGALGEAWLGSARHARSALAILVGTGIGGGFVRKGKLWRGSREAACEVGHIVMQIDGPPCGCGNRGCLEALASRTAIENQLRQAVAAGETTILTELLHGDLTIIRSRTLRQALDAGDRLVTRIMHRAAEMLGYACLTVRHLLDPEVIVLGGGLIEACSEFLLPIVENIVGSDQLPGAREGGQVLLSALGDDAVVLGAVALARTHVGRSPFKKRFALCPPYPKIASFRFGEITVGQKTYTRDLYILADGTLKKRKKALARQEYHTAHMVGPKELERVCRAGPEVLFVGTGERGGLRLSDEALRYLSQRSIECRAMPTPELIEAYNKCAKRKAALIHVTC